ncbi:glycolate oxidase subunit GlcE [Dongia sp. agr-C8]
MELLSPASLAEAADCVRAAIADKAPLEILGASSKRGFGRPVDAARQLTTAAMSGIVSYHPEELVMVARAGTHMDEIAAALQERNQFLAFEPPDFGKLYPGSDAGGNRTGTLGGILATNLSGPRRFKAGAARDHFLGFTAVNGRGEIFKGGGPVVKNVTGYDLPKLLAGSFGTLALMDEVTVKVLPRPEKTRTVLLYGLDATAANAAMTKALTGPYDISAAAFLPQIQAQSSDCDYVGAQGSVTALRVEGSGPVVEHHCAALRRDFADDVAGATEELHSANSMTLWREIRDLHPFFDTDTILWRISVPPAHGAAVAASCAIDIPGSNFLLDWGGGLVWLSIPANGGAHAEQVRRAFQRCGGHATLVRASEAERRKIQVFEAEGSRALTEQVKRSFDPQRVLNPGRMFEGI